MNWQKFISTILHPVVMPTIGVLLYLIYIPTPLNGKQRLTLLGIIFLTTYIIPLLLLLFLQSIGKIKDFRVHSIEERKIPLIIMFTLFLGLGKSFSRNSVTQDIGLLFYGTAIAIACIYLLFIFKIKTSLHLLSIGSAVGFFIIMQQFYSLSIFHIIAILILLSGVLASSRLYLKAHTSKEVYLGFFLGITCQLIAQFFIYL